MMFKHAINFAIRSFRSRKLIFFESILTVFLGTLSISLLYTYVNNELTMDNFNKREKDILITALRESVNGQLRGICASKFLEYDYKDEPGIECYTSVLKYNKGEMIAIYAEKSYLPEMF